MAHGASSREVEPGRGQAPAKRAWRNSSGLPKSTARAAQIKTAVCRRTDPLSFAFLFRLKQILMVRVRLSLN
jgi:hypothetical protein